MKIFLLSVGHKLEPFEEAWIGLFEQRLATFSKVTSVRVKDGPKAWDELEKKIPERSALILLDVKGKSYSTETLKDWLEGQLMKSSSLTFVIGGSHGFPREALARADHVISLSTLTFAHRIAHLVFIEQLYRVFCLRAGHPYHHA